MHLSKHERDCHLRANEWDWTGQYGMITEISGQVYFRKSHSMTFHEWQMRTGDTVPNDHE
jgi:hypothetical protein